MKWAALAFGLWAGSARAACRQALVLGLDVSGSVDGAEYRLQLEGVARALDSAEVQAVALAMPQAPIRLAVYEWGGEAQQRVLVDWVTLQSRDDMADVAAKLRAVESRYDDPDTAIGSAVLWGAGMLKTQDCWQKTLDISGDGPSNTGPHPGRLAGAVVSGITVNGLVVGPRARANTTKDLSQVTSLLTYYEGHVIRGPGAFVETAQDYADFAEAMRRKLQKEMAAPQIVQARPRATKTAGEP
jgi:hypothetical protein